MLNPPSSDTLLNIPLLYTTQEIKPEDTIIHGHFFLGRCDWFVAEYDGEDQFFGYAYLGDLEMAEWGYFSFAELKSIVVKSPVIEARTHEPIATFLAQVEWDEYWHPKPFHQIQDALFSRTLAARN